MDKRHIARDISYASSAATRRGRVVIRALEAATGKYSLIRRAKDYDREISDKHSFWDVMSRRYGVTVDVRQGRLDEIPDTGPVVIVANHPYGILDGMVMGLILSRVRSEFRILANEVFGGAPDLAQAILPVSFDGTREAMATNIKTRSKAIDILERGGAIGIFPGGTVSTAAKPFSRPLDPTWRNFTAQMIARSKATVVPIYFDGTNSRLFQLASHLHVTLRMGLLLREFKAKIDKPVRISVGAPIFPSSLPKDRTEIMDFLRKATYDLAPKPVPEDAVGFEFEERYRRGDRDI